MAVVALALAPARMPASYSWTTHTVSESAAQGVDGAWLARLGLMLFGFSVLLLASQPGTGWGLPGRCLHATFGALLVATAVFSHRPWEAGVPFDETEDLLHSLAATAMGFAFTPGVLLVAFKRAGMARIRDAIAIGVSIVVPLSMTVVTGQVGLLQRLMFVVGMFWYATEAARLAFRFRTHCQS